MMAARWPPLALPANINTTDKYYLTVTEADLRAARGVADRAVEGVKFDAR